ncbi:MAG: nitroreductase family protein [Bacteroidales bacterium]|nr:nitroreductase family protein [Bacteroidales bacterium]
MEVSEAIFTRRSIRRYSNKNVENEKVDKIIKAGMYAPSAVNKQPWHFIIFKDSGTFRKIIEVHKNASMLENASVAILVCFDENLQHDDGYGLLDCSAATQNMLLMAHNLGIGSCWIGIFPRENRMKSMSEIFNLPYNIIPLAIVSLGYPAEQKVTPDRYKEDRIHYENW